MKTEIRALLSEEVIIVNVFDENDNLVNMRKTNIKFFEKYDISLLGEEVSELELEEILNSIKKANEEYVFTPSRNWCEVDPFTRQMDNSNWK